MNAEVRQLRIGIDLGGTKTEGIVVGAGLSSSTARPADSGGTLAASPPTGELFRQRVPTPAAQGYDAIVSTVVDLVRDLEAECLKLPGSSDQPIPVGIGAPGSVSQRTGGLKNSNTQCLIGRPLRQDLEQRLGRPIRIANDANCFALSEALDGAGRAHGVVFGVILGTGVGGGVVFDGRVHAGPNDVAGEWGHTPLVPDGVECYCGHVGCVETVLSGPGLARDHLRVTGERLEGPEIVARALGGDSNAVGTLDRYVDHFGRAMATVIDILDPDCVVLGGGLSSIERLYEDGPSAIEKYLFNDELNTPLVRNVHGDSSGVRGAAFLW